MLFRISEKTFEELKRQAITQHRSVNSLINFIVDQYINQKLVEKTVSEKEDIYERLRKLQYED